MSMYLENISIQHNDLKFKCSITIKNGSINVCITCIGTTCVKDQKCLLSITTKQIKDNHKSAIMSDYYDELLKGINGASKISPKLKGAIYAVLCILLHKAVEQGILAHDDVIYINKSNKDFLDQEVNKYYNNLGFVYDSDSETFVGTVKQVFSVCSDKKAIISKELQNVIHQSF